MKKNTLKDGLDAKMDAKRDAKSSFCCSVSQSQLMELLNLVIIINKHMPISVRSKIRGIITLQQKLDLASLFASFFASRPYFSVFFFIFWTKWRNFTGWCYLRHFLHPFSKSGANCGVICTRFCTQLCARFCIRFCDRFLAQFCT